ncbi:MAG TPA: hypothetical protein DDZ84_04135 [Firmicutes bacterium]|nr:hypothetical protein [Bacillota bacterium]
MTSGEPQDPANASTGGLVVNAILFKKVDYSLSKLILDIEHGDIGLPDIQRPFVWKPVKVRDLFDSMYKGIPIRLKAKWSPTLPGSGALGLPMTSCLFSMGLQGMH